MWNSEKSSFVHLEGTSSAAMMKILSDEISTASASYSRIIFNLCEIGLCFDKLPFELSTKRKVLTSTEVLKKLICFMRVKELLSSQDSRVKWMFTASTPKLAGVCWFFKRRDWPYSHFLQTQESTCLFLISLFTFYIVLYSTKCHVLPHKHARTPGEL